MKIKIYNPKQDMQGNQRENIFIVMHEKDFLGSGYVFPKLSPLLTPDHALNIFLEMHLDDVYLTHEIGDKLLYALEKRALDLKMVQSQKALFYFGSEDPDHPFLSYLASKGFDHKMETYKMKTHTKVDRLDLPAPYTLSETLNEESFLELYNKIFIKQLTKETLEHLRSHEGYKYISVYEEEQLIGFILGYFDHEEVKLGKIEALYVHKEHQNKGLGKYLVKSILSYFGQNFINEAVLEVWSENKHAIEIYKSLDFNICESTEHYIGKFL